MLVICINNESLLMNILAFICSRYSAKLYYMLSKEMYALGASKPICILPSRLSPELPLTLSCLLQM